uniref:Uncharacterized protein n=1 Tax=Romanomermis culicivorax TaxID=13658 RepID=A0A915K973_ROMCU
MADSEPLSHLNPVKREHRRRKCCNSLTSTMTKRSSWDFLKHDFDDDMDQWMSSRMVKSEYTLRKT